MVEENRGEQDAKMSSKQFGLLLFLGAKKEEIKGLTMKQASAKIQELQKAHGLPVTEPKPRTAKPQMQESRQQQLPLEPKPLTLADQNRMLGDAKREVMEVLNVPEEKVMNLGEIIAQKFGAKLQQQSQEYWLQNAKWEHMLKTGRINSVKGR